MIRVVTQILRLFQGVFTRMGVDFDRMLAIVTVRLTVDNRIDRSGRNKKNASNALMRQGILLGICGPIFFLTGIASGAFGVSLIPVVPVSDVDDEFYDGIFPDSF